MTTLNKVLITLLVATVAAASLTAAQDIRQNPNAKPAALQSTKQNKFANETLTSAGCGTLADVALKVQACAKPLMDLLTGSIPKWPRTNQDAKDQCDSFIVSEKCIRDVGRKCTKGLHKTIISTLANSISRARKRECQTPKYPAILKTTLCLEKHQDVVKNLMGNVMGRLEVIESKFNDLDKKMSGICCMVHTIENEIRDLLKSRCPVEGQLVVRLYRGVLEDVIQLICQQPKCNDLFKGYKLSKSDNFDGIISILLRIVFSLG